MLKALFGCAEKSCGPDENCEDVTSYTFVEETEEGASIAEGLNLLSGFVETVATVVKMCLPVAKDFPEEVVDFAKCVPVVNPALQVVVMWASLAEMGMEMKCARVEWLPFMLEWRILQGLKWKN